MGDLRDHQVIFYAFMPQHKQPSTENQQGAPGPILHIPAAARPIFFLRSIALPKQRQSAVTRAMSTLGAIETAC